MEKSVFQIMNEKGGYLTAFANKNFAETCKTLLESELNEKFKVVETKYNWSDSVDDDNCDPDTCTAVIGEIRGVLLEGNPVLNPSLIAKVVKKLNPKNIWCILKFLEIHNITNDYDAINIANFTALAEAEHIRNKNEDSELEMKEVMSSYLTDKHLKEPTYLYVPYVNGKYYYDVSKSKTYEDAKEYLEEICDILNTGEPAINWLFPNDENVCIKKMMKCELKSALEKYKNGCATTPKKEESNANSISPEVRLEVKKSLNNVID